MKNFEHLQYTFLHRYALNFVIEKHIKDAYLKKVLLERAKWHDLDKAFLYTLIPKPDASAYHKLHSQHHFHLQNPTNKSIVDIYEAVMDFESAGYTKPDKPRNAYDTINALSFQHKDELMKCTSCLGINYSYQNTPNDQEWIEYLDTMPILTEERMTKEIYEWVLNYPIQAKAELQYAEQFLS